MTYDTPVVDIGTVAATSRAFNVTVSGGTNAWMLAALWNGGSGFTLTGAPTYNGVPLTQILLQNATPLFANLYAYQLVNPASGTNSFSAAFSASVTWTIAIIVGYTIEQVTPTDTPDTDTTGNHVSSTSATTASELGDEVLDIVATGNIASNLFTAGAGQTIMVQAFNSTELHSLSISRKDGAASVTQTWDFSPSSGDVGYYQTQINVNGIIIPTFVPIGQLTTGLIARQQRYPRR